MAAIVKAGTEVRFERIFDAPRDLVFACWTDARHLKAWWGPAGSENGETRIDPRPGGDIFIQMRGPGFDHPMGGTVEEIDPPRRLVFLSKAFRNPDGSWAFVNRNTVLFEDVGTGTRVRLHTLVLSASEEFAVPVDNMKEGWAGSLDRLAAHLAKTA
ncbi:MAG: SRPBCC domain-containing protein [Alphaproteobacteria bacterium]|nr:SRPBCC domain-containing protein [Alphaproteobacteria bacterium]MBL7098635.1 SRPBCC domain-containing protein [Alphaproteobacteria bacterium]